MRALIALLPLLVFSPVSAAMLNAAVRSSTAPVDGEDAPTAGSSLEGNGASEAKRDDYEQRARQELASLRAQLNEAQKSADTLSTEARREAALRVADLKKRVDQAQTQVGELERSGERRWQTVKGHLDSTMKSLRREYESLKKDLDAGDGKK